MPQTMPSFVVLPSWDASSIALHVGLASLAVIYPLADRHDLIRVRYSKFRSGEGIDGRTGMFLLYFVPLVVLLVSAFATLRAPDVVQLVCIAALALHFVKRCLEVLFVHRYGGPIDVPTTLQIMTSYSLVGWFGVWLLAKPVATLDAVFALGGALYVVGEAGNLAHHVLLAKLRERETGYFIPRGGLFEKVACPHYLFELVAWLGMAMMWRRSEMYLVLVSMTAYLATRARKNDAWYRERFPDYPASRRALVPGVF